MSHGQHSLFHTLSVYCSASHVCKQHLPAQPSAPSMAQHPQFSPAPRQCTAAPALDPSPGLPDPGPPNALRWPLWVVCGFSATPVINCRAFLRAGSKEQRGLIISPTPRPPRLSSSWKSGQALELPRAVVESQSMEILKKHVDVALWDMF